MSKYKRKVFIEIPNSFYDWYYSLCYGCLTPLQKENFKNCPKRDRMPKELSLKSVRNINIVNNKREARRVWKI